MKTKLTTAVLTSIVLLAFMTSSAFATPQKGERRKGPPPEAIEACESLQEGDKVSFETPRGDTLEAQCLIVDEVLVAVPLNHKRPE